MSDSETTQATKRNPAVGYVLPLVLYVLGTSFIARFGDDAYPLAYSVVVALVGIAAIFLLRGAEAFQPHWRVAPGVLVGLIGIGLWIVICHFEPEQWVAQWLPSFLQPKPRVGFNPFEQLGNGAFAWSFIAVRLVGIALLVPIIEEVFWRGFLLRWLIDPDWQRVKTGEYTLHSCWLVTFLFTLAHPEWLAAAVYCLLVNGLLYWTKDLWQCVVAHMVSNLALAIYVLVTGVWVLW